MGRMFVDLCLGKGFSAVLKTFPVYGRENSSLSSPSSLNGLQAFDLKHNGDQAGAEIILPEIWAMLPMLPTSPAIKTTNGGNANANRNIW